jgi:hypothetical protein
MPTKGGVICPVGYTCTQGDKTACPIGQYCESHSMTAAAVSDPTNWSALLKPPVDCEAGFYCAGGTNARRPVNLASEFGA